MKLDFTLPPDKQPIPDKAKKVFTGELFSIYQWEQVLYDGSTTIFEKLRRDDTIGVVAVTSEEKIIITEQEQPGIAKFYSLPGGRIDPGETVSDAAVRELREETGMRATEWKSWFAMRPLEKIDWVIYAAVAQGCQRVGELLLDPGEKIKLHQLTFDEFVAITREPQFRDLEITTLLYKAENEKRLSDIKSLFFG